MGVPSRGANNPLVSPAALIAVIAAESKPGMSEARIVSTVANVPLEPTVARYAPVSVGERSTACALAEIRRKLGVITGPEKTVTRWNRAYDQFVGSMKAQ